MKERREERDKGVDCAPTARLEHSDSDQQITLECAAIDWKIFMVHEIENTFCTW